MTFMEELQVLLFTGQYMTRKFMLCGTQAFIRSLAYIHRAQMHQMRLVDGAHRNPLFSPGLLAL